MLLDSSKYSIIAFIITICSEAGRSEKACREGKGGSAWAGRRDQGEVVGEPVTDGD